MHRRLFCALSLLLLQTLIESFSSQLIEFCALFAIYCEVASSSISSVGERSPGRSCPECWNHSFAKLNGTLSDPSGSCCFPAKLSERLVLFVTESSGMTCNTSDLSFNLLCNNSNSELQDWNRLLRFLSSGSKWAKSIRNGVSFGNEETQDSLWREEPGQCTAWTEAYSQWDPQRKDSGPNSHKGFY